MPEEVLTEWPDLHLQRRVFKRSSFLTETRRQISDLHMANQISQGSAFLLDKMTCLHNVARISSRRFFRKLTALNLKRYQSRGVERRQRRRRRRRKKKAAVSEGYSRDSAASSCDGPAQPASQSTGGDHKYSVEIGRSVNWGQTNS